MLAILPKGSIQDAWLGPECTSADEYNAAFKTQEKISLAVK